ncbi:MAG: DUF3144 domain-containing protein [Thermomonas sp.]|uniref:DUF3144 domain-containing protein n=1 Tax=Thermomonas sp. TaxID=1971895 RepID=UPI0039E3FB39
MADEQAQQGQQGSNQVDPAFLEAVNEYLQLADTHTRKVGPKGPSLAILFAAARFNAHVFLLSVKPIDAAKERAAFLDYMSTMYRRMLNEHLDGIGEERGIDVGDSELAEDYKAAGVKIGRLKDAGANGAGNSAPTPAGDYVAAAGAVPPSNAANE